MQNLVITSAGQELMTSLIADGATASFTKIATSEHEYLQSELETLTSLEDIKQEVAISKLERKDESSIEILAGATNEELTEGYYVKALGLYIKDGEGNEILYAVAIDDTPDYLPAFNNTAISNIIYRLNVKVSNSAQVTLEIAQDAYATAIQAKELQEQIDAITEKEEKYAQKDGSNATGTWGINITGNAKTATKATTADSAATATSATSATSAAKWSTARNINGMSVNGSENRVNYGTCSTAAATAAKTVSCTGFALATGAEITVKFTVTNTASSPTLNVNSTGAKPIYYRGAAITAGYLAANRTYTFRYNGTQYELVGDINVDTNTTYSAGAGLSLTGTEFSAKIANNLTTTEEGYALDAKQGKVLKEQIDAITEKEENYAQKDGSNATGTWDINITGNANTSTTAEKLSGFSAASATIDWGTLISSNGYTSITQMETENGGSVAFADKDQNAYMQLDGVIYQNEGKYKVLDSSDVELFGGIFPPDQIKDTFIDCDKKASVTFNIADIKCNSQNFTVLIKVTANKACTFSEKSFWYNSNIYGCGKSIYRCKYTSTDTNNTSGTYEVSDKVNHGRMLDYNFNVSYDAETGDFTVTNNGYWASKVEVLAIPTAFEELSPIFGKTLYEVSTGLDKKANADGTNAEGSWDIDITGNSETATKATTADTATMATQDADGNVIADTYSKTGHTHNYAGSSSAGGAATSAEKLSASAGSALAPVYFSNGVPVETKLKSTYINVGSPTSTTFTLNKNTSYLITIALGTYYRYYAGLLLCNSSSQDTWGTITLHDNTAERNVPVSLSVAWDSSSGTGKLTINFTDTGSSYGKYVRIISF